MPLPALGVTGSPVRNDAQRRNEEGRRKARKKKGWRNSRVKIRDIQHHRTPIRLDGDGGGLVEVRGNVGVAARLGGGQAL
jgi:hypothetical protein